MNWKKENPDLNRRWTQLETKKFLKAMRNHQLLWIPYIFPKMENDMVVKAAQDRLIEQTKRPWTDIAYQLAKLRFLFRKETKNWRYYKEMKRSLTVDGKVRKTKDMNQFLVIFVQFFGCTYFFISDNRFDRKIDR